MLNSICMTFLLLRESHFFDYERQSLVPIIMYEGTYEGAHYVALAVLKVAILLVLSSKG